MPPKVLSSERVEDSSDEDSSTSTPTQTLQQKISALPAQRQKPTDQSSESDSSDTESNASSKASTSSKTSSSTSSLRKKRKATDDPKPVQKSSPKRTRVDYSNVKRIESTNYVPPQGWSTTKAKATDFPSETNGMFNDLEGKQLWHISAHSSMDISKLKSLNVSEALKGAPILEHKGVRYNLSQGHIGNAVVLLPAGTRNEYAPTSSSIAQSFQIQEFVPTSNGAALVNGQHDNDDSTTATTFFATQTGQKKPPRQQPENLRPRYTPFGVQENTTPGTLGNSTASDAGSAMEGVVLGNSEAQGGNTEQTPKSSKKSHRKKEKAVDIGSEVQEMSPTSRRNSQVSSIVNGTPVEGKERSHKKKKKKEKKLDS